MLSNHHAYALASPLDAGRMPDLDPTPTRTERHLAVVHPTPPDPSALATARTQPPGKRRRLAPLVAVALLHVAAVWVLSIGVPQRTSAPVVPSISLVQVLLQPAPAPSPETPAPKMPKQPPEPVQKAQPAIEKVAEEAPQTVFQPTPVAPSESPLQPSASAAPAAPAPAKATPNPAPAPAPATATSPALELPSSDADYLNNPKPPYPPVSKRLSEQGLVIVRTLIGADGIAQRAEIYQSSGYFRLDQAALATALRWRYVPGKRAGVAEAMWFNVPFNFVLN